MPIGPVGHPTEFQLFFNQMIFKYTKYPKAAKEFLRFMMEPEQLDPWVQASIGYVTPALRYYEKNPIWTSDPKHTPYRNSMVNMVPSGYAGKMGYASAGALADFIVVNMVAEAASGIEDAEGSGGAGAEAGGALLQGLKFRRAAKGRSYFLPFRAT